MSSNPLALALEQAYKRYLNKKTNPFTRECDKEFLLQVFDISKDSSNCDAEIKDMIEQQKALANSHLIPAFFTKTNAFTKDHSKNHLDKILSVTDDKKAWDKKLKIPMLNAVQRAPYQLIISNGKFYQQKNHCFELFDSSQYGSHDKRGFVAFTMNLNGEIHCFNHNFKQGLTTIVHSSMNHGEPVFMAGEMKIIKGEVKAISNYSGHYCPSFDHLLRFCQYLQERKIKLSDYLNLISHQDKQIFNFKTIKEQKENLFENISKRSQSYQADARFTLEFGLRAKRKALIKKYQDKLNMLKKCSPISIKECTIEIKALTQEILTENETLSINHYKNKNNGRLHLTLSKILRELEEKQQEHHDFTLTARMW